MSMTDSYAFDLALNLDVISEGVFAFVLGCYTAAHQLRFFRRVDANRIAARALWQRALWKRALWDTHQSLGV